MGDPHDPTRSGERWNLHRLAVLQRELDAMRDYGVISGGWAWHLMSPPHHEVKQLHDHKDVDFFPFPDHFSALVVLLKDRGYTKSWTRFDDPSSEFIRYAKHIVACPTCLHDDIRIQENTWRCPECGKTGRGDPESVKVILDLFVEQVRSVEVPGGYRVVEPSTLLGFYSHKHESRECIAVVNAKRLIARGHDVVGHSDLVGPWGR